LWFDKQQTREKREWAEGRRGDLCAIIDPDKSAQVDDDFAFALGKFALTPFADCLGD